MPDIAKPTNPQDHPRRQPKTWRGLLPVHAAAALFPPMLPDELRVLGEDILEHGLTSAIALWLSSEGQAFLLDGCNRLDAIEAATGQHVEVVVEDGKWVIDAGVWISDQVIVLDNAIDPYTWVDSANIRRRHLSAGQTREVIAKLIKVDPSKSDRQIAETVKASPTTVGTVRAKMEAAGDVSKLTTRRDSKGRNQPAKKKRGKTPSETPARPIHTGIYAPEKRGDIGPNSGGEAEHQRVRNEELERENRRLARENAALRREIEELRARLPAPIDHGDGGGDGRDDLDIPAFLDRTREARP